MKENFLEALQEILSHKMRSFLTMLGVIIGIASIISIVSTIKGTNDRIMQDLVGKGNNNVTIALYRGNTPVDFEEGSISGVSLVSSGQMERIRELDHVEDATFFTHRDSVYNVSAGGVLLDSGAIYGIDDHFLNTCGYAVYRGRRFVEADQINHNKVALLDSAASDVLFSGRDPLGKTIEISGEPFIVVGLIQKESEYQPAIENLTDYETYMEQSYGMVLIPSADWGITYLFDEPQNAYVRADTTENMSAVGKAAQKILQESVSSSDLSYVAEDLVEEAKEQQQLTASTNRLLIWVAGISLLVGGIGVMNIMLVSVTERTREIGLRRSLGARKRRILLQFLTESAVLTSLGGIFGVLMGLIMAQVISKLSGVEVGISLPAIAIAVVFSMVIGIVFGLLPSIKAANLNPIDALRRE